jgi:hypothetical protein
MEEDKLKYSEQGGPQPDYGNMLLQRLTYIGINTIQATA